VTFNVPGGGPVGVLVRNSTNSTIENNVIKGSQRGVLLSDADENEIKNNEIVLSGDIGIRLENGAADNTIEGNSVSGSLNVGIQADVGAGSGNKIFQNIVFSRGRADIEVLLADPGVVDIDQNICQVSVPFGYCPTETPNFEIEHF